ncbi:enoyl-CoA delta isomerase 1, mitochondrial-like isoform X1 [Anneissia japonica]|uniref:enoyl-CoA delta isomerase 1, mitochondrial-like isoform X1 n=1 Tax=Anneissia japonica TaxID=1529436 RepID=UPI001425AF0C|nr:enoyl-CoA delta isomerase 1, mitochondrial-like isoform X1 [Anneissia japonica]
MMSMNNLFYSMQAWRLLNRGGRLLHLSPSQHIQKLSSRSNQLGFCQVLAAFTQIQRSYTERANYIHVEQDADIQDISILRFDRKPVNGLNKDFLIEMDMALEKLENNPSCRGVILTSAFPKIFSAGLDITEMYQKSHDYTNAFWRSLQNMWLRLYGSRLVTMAAINGHSPAGGCLIAMSCDLRVMASGPYTIGLNETLLGIVAPFWFMDTMKNTVGQRETEIALQLGKLYSPEEALEKGLVDILAADTEVVNVAKSHMVNWLKIPDHAREISKQMMRKKTLEKLRTRQDDDIAYFTNFIQKDSIQKSLGRYLQSLKKKK